MNQKLCDIRTQSASAAITNLDAEFQIARTDTEDDDLSEADITSLRQGYAKDLFEDKKFIFGKYTVQQDGTVSTLSLPIATIAFYYLFYRSENHSLIKAGSF